MEMNKMQTIQEIINIIVDENENVDIRHFERSHIIVGSKNINNCELKAIWRGAQPHSHLPDNKFAGWNLYIDELNAKNWTHKLLLEIKERLVLPN